MRAPEEITSLWRERKAAQEPWMATAREAKAMYNGDIVIPLPELDDIEKPAVPNLLAQGVDQTAMRIASTSPNPFFMATKTGVKVQEEAARTRRQVMLGTWDWNEMPMKDRRRARHLITYSSSPVQIEIDHEYKMQRWTVRNPLDSFPSASGDPDSMLPSDCIFWSQRSLGWLTKRYPDAMNSISRRRDPFGRPQNKAEMFDVLEYVDGEAIQCVLVGKPLTDSPNMGEMAIELFNYPNIAGRCPVVIPGRVTLDRPQGQFDQMMGMFYQQAKLQAGAVIATWRGIFKDEWFVARPNEVPKIITQANGRRGIYGKVQGADLQVVGADPSYMTNPMIDRLERNQRLDGGVPAQFGGESATGVRTGRASDNVLAAVVDFPIQEAQEAMAIARKHEDKIAIAFDKAYNTKTVSFNGLEVSYKPRELWATDEHKVTYSQAGVDANGLTIQVGQLNGIGMMSKRRGMELLPLIDDPEREHDRLISEGIEQALLASIQQQASQPGANVADYARIMELVSTDKMELAQAVQQVQREAQERQAAIDAQGNPTPTVPGSPETQPGLAGPGMGAEAGTAIPEVSPSVQNLSQLLSNLRNPQRTIASERQPVGV